MAGNDDRYPTDRWDPNQGPNPRLRPAALTSHAPGAHAEATMLIPHTTGNTQVLVQWSAVHPHYPSLSNQIIINTLGKDQAAAMEVIQQQLRRSKVPFRVDKGSVLIDTFDYRVFSGHPYESVKSICEGALRDCPTSEALNAAADAARLERNTASTAAKPRTAEPSTPGADPAKPPTEPTAAPKTQPTTPPEPPSTGGAAEPTAPKPPAAAPEIPPSPKTPASPTQPTTTPEPPSTGGASALPDAKTTSPKPTAAIPRPSTPELWGEVRTRVWYKNMYEYMNNLSRELEAFPDKVSQLQTENPRLLRTFREWNKLSQADKADLRKLRDLSYPFERSMAEWKVAPQSVAGAEPAGGTQPAEATAPKPTGAAPEIPPSPTTGPGETGTRVNRSLGPVDGIPTGRNGPGPIPEEPASTGELPFERGLGRNTSQPEGMVASGPQPSTGTFIEVEPGVYKPDGFIDPNEMLRKARNLTLEGKVTIQYPVAGGKYKLVDITFGDTMQDIRHTIAKAPIVNTPPAEPPAPSRAGSQTAEPPASDPAKMHKKITARTSYTPSVSPEYYREINEIIQFEKDINSYEYRTLGEDGLRKMWENTPRSTYLEYKKEWPRWRELHELTKDAAKRATPPSAPGSSEAGAPATEPTAPTPPGAAPEPSLQPSSGTTAEPVARPSGGTGTGTAAPDAGAAGAQPETLQESLARIQNDRVQLFESYQKLSPRQYKLLTDGNPALRRELEAFRASKAANVAGQGTGGAPASPSTEPNAPKPPGAAPEPSTPGSSGARAGNILGKLGKVLQTEIPLLQGAEGVGKIFGKALLPVAAMIKGTEGARVKSLESAAAGDGSSPTEAGKAGAVGGVVEVGVTGLPTLLLRGANLIPGVDGIKLNNDVNVTIPIIDYNLGMQNRSTFWERIEQIKATPGKLGEALFPADKVPKGYDPVTNAAAKAKLPEGSGPESMPKKEVIKLVTPILSEVVAEKSTLELKRENMWWWESKTEIDEKIHKLAEQAEGLASMQGRANNELAEAAKAQPQTKATPLTVTTGNATPGPAEGLAAITDSANSQAAMPGQETSGPTGPNGPAVAKGKETSQGASPN